MLARRSEAGGVRQRVELPQHSRHRGRRVKRSLQPNSERPLAPGATPMRATTHGQTVQLGRQRERPFKTRLATLREGYRARTKNQKFRARQQMELPQRCRRPACKDKQPKGKADYQHHGGVPGRRGRLYKREERAHREQSRTRAGRPTELPWCLPARARKEATAAAGTRVSLAPRGLLKRAGRSNAPLRG